MLSVPIYRRDMVYFIVLHLYLTIEYLTILIYVRYAAILAAKKK